MSGVEGGVRIALFGAALLFSALAVVAAIFDCDGAAIFCGTMAGAALLCGTSQWGSLA